MVETEAPDQSGYSSDRRKLIAVVYADMVGYSRLIGLDDAETLERLRAVRRTVIDPAIAEHGGRIVQTGGDSLLMVFDSIDGAVRCAVKVQQQIPHHDAGHTPDKAIRFRVGIDIGDAIAEGTDLHGDGVIVAARLQGECQPGGICVSRAVRDHVHDRLDLAFETLGLLSLKNITRPVEAFVLRPSFATANSVERMIVEDTTKTLPLPDRPSIAVLAFTNMSGDPEQEYFSDGIAEDITTELSRMRSLFVIARNSSFTYKGHAVDARQVARELGVHYIVEGSVRRAGNRIRIVAQLIDAITGSHVWAERFDRDLADIFAVQDEITHSIVQALGPAISQAEQQRALRRPPESLSAWEAYQRALSHWSVSGDLTVSVEFLRRAVALDPRFAPPHAMLALHHILEIALGGRDFAEGLSEAELEARTAIELDRESAIAHSSLAWVLTHHDEPEAALDEAEIAILLNPNDPQGHAVKGRVLVFTGRTAEARDSLTTALRLDPRGPTALAAMAHTVMCNYFERDYRAAEGMARRTARAYPKSVRPLLWLTAALGQLGRAEEGRKVLDSIIAATPSYVEFITRTRPRYYHRPEDYDHLLEGLRKAGVEGLTMSATKESDLSGKSLGGRKLIAVLYADMVGYSRLIGLDDVGTLERLRALRSGLIDPSIAEHGGKIVQTGGDSLLIVFDSIEGAVRCAVNVQQQVPQHDGGHTADRSIRYRIGIDIGDAIADGTDLHGNGVIVAARLQAECPPGSICVSRAVRDHVHDRLDLAFKSLGPLNLKNIARPVEAFVLRPAAADAPGSAKTFLLGNTPETMALPDRPSIAVLAFTNMSGDPEQEYFSDGIADDIITELSRMRRLFVIARNTSFTYKGHAIDVKQVGRELGVRYVLEGSVRRGGQRVRVNAQLIDAETGAHVWAQRYDRDLVDVFAVQDEITLAVTGAIGPAVADAEQRRALRKLPGNLGAWECYHRGMWHLSRARSENVPVARELFDHALELDPMLAAAHTGLAMAFNREGAVYASRPLLEALRLSGDEAQKALELDPTDADAHGFRAHAAGHLGDYAAGFDHVERALSINPNCAWAHHVKGWLQIFTGRPAEGRQAILCSIRLDPRRASYPFVRSHIVMSYYIESDYETTVAEAACLIADRPAHPYAYRWLAAALGQLGRSDEARAALDKALETAPDAFRLYVEQRVPWMGQPVYDHMLDGLRKAGWQG